MNLVLQGEVLRGMGVEPQPLRVGRTAPPAEEAENTLAQEGSLQALEAERRAARAEGEQAGYAEGLRRGRADAAEESRTALQKAVAEARAVLDKHGDRLAALFKSLEDQRSEIHRLAEDDLVASCFEIVCRIVGETALDADAVRAQVRRGVAACGDSAIVAVEVHPQDLELLRNTTALHHFPFAASDDVALGGCMVRRPGNSLDARLETALATCRESLLATRARRANAQEGA